MWNVPGRYARGSNYVMLWAGSHQIVSAATDWCPWQGSTPGRSCGFSRASNGNERCDSTALARTACLIEGQSWQPGCVLLGGRALTEYCFGKCGFLPTRVYQPASSYPRPGVRVRVVWFFGSDYLGLCVGRCFYGSCFFSGFWKKCTETWKSFLEPICSDCYIGNLWLEKTVKKR